MCRPGDNTLVSWGRRALLKLPYYLTKTFFFYFALLNLDNELSYEAQSKKKKNRTGKGINAFKEQKQQRL